MSTKQPRTVRDIAVECGVSSATVSRVLTGKANPDLESTRKIEKLLRKYKYRRQRKVKSQAKVLAVMGYQDIGASEHGTLMSVALHEAANEQNIQFQTHFASEIIPEEIAGIVSEQQIDIVITVAQSVHLDKASCNRPVICLTQERFYDPDAICIDSDDIVGFAQAMRYLVSLGHKRIGFFCDYKNGERLHVQGTRAMIPLLYEQCGLPTDPSLIWQKDFPSGEHAPVITEAVEYFCAMENRPTALMVLGDQYMPCFYSDLQARGVVPGKDISMVGYSGSATGEMISPPVTTIRKNFKLLAREAMAVSLELVNNPDYDPKRIMIPPEFIVRASTSPIG